jgi:transcription antitermination factor NusG
MSIEEVRGTVPQRWFALQVKTHCERAVATVVRHKGFEEFVPLYRRCHRWSDRLKSVDLPLFPGYVFCRIDPRFRLPVLTIPGALHFAGIGRVPAPIDDSEIAAIQNAVHSGLAVEPWEYLDAGQLVRLDGGPLASLEGILIETPTQHRVVVSVTLLRRSVAVEIDRRWVTPIDASRRGAFITSSA